MNNKFLNKINLFLLFSILLLAGAAQQSLAATLTVTKAADTNDAVCNADCSLREAVAVAQEYDEIKFAANLAGQTITLSNSISISKSLTITGIDTLKISGGNLVRIFSIMNGAKATLRNLDLGNGYMDSRQQPFVGVGGAIAVYWSSLELDDCYVHNSKAFTWGGGIWAIGSAVIIKNSLIAANKANAGGGGISIQGSRLSISNTRFNLNGAATNGGAVWVSDCRMLMRDSSIYKSSAKSGGALYLTEANDKGVYTIRDSAIHHNSAQSAGGIYNEATLNLINSTVSSNYATAGSGGGLSNHNQAFLRNVTMTLNNATGDAGGINSVSGDVNFGNTIVAANTNAGNFSPNIKGNVTSAGFNVIGPSVSAVFWGDQTGNQFNVIDPMLMPLAYNGSVTLNHHPKAGSPVIDAGSDALATDEFNNMLLTDQRGVNRISGGVVDIGAVETVNE
ncbi:MAG TPA: CSLREA domain-containing protein [Pyrinomonadaceae bacterium]|nr:CSLREA domain-containing protein [Pyrinomonadaceae bacterium]